MASEPAQPPAVAVTLQPATACGSAATCGGRENFSQRRIFEVGRAKRQCVTSLNGDISKWDMSSVNAQHLSTATSRSGMCQTSMGNVFQRRHLEVGCVKRQCATSLNGDISKWDVSSVNAQRLSTATSRSGTCQSQRLSTATSRSGTCQASMSSIFQRRHLEVGRVKRSNAEKSENS